MKSMGFEKLQVFPRQTMLKVGMLHYAKALDRIFFKGKDKDGRTLKRYTEKYAELKARGFKRKSDGRNYANLAQYSLDRQIYPPNLTLRAVTRRNFEHNRVRGYSKTYWELGWDGEAGKIINAQKEQGRDVVSSIPQKELNWCRDQLIKEMEIQFGKKLKDITITVG